MTDQKTQAKQLKSNQLLWNLFDERHREVHDQWENSRDTEQRECLWHELNALNELRGLIDGRIAELTRDE